MHSWNKNNRNTHAQLRNSTNYRFLPSWRLLLTSQTSFPASGCPHGCILPHPPPTPFHFKLDSLYYVRLFTWLWHCWISSHHTPRPPPLLTTSPPPCSQHSTKKLIMKSESDAVNNSDGSSVGPASPLLSSKCT